MSKLKITLWIEDEEGDFKPSPHPQDIIVATVGNPVVSKGTSKMATQVFPAVGDSPLHNSAAPLVTKIPLTGFELFNGTSGADDGPDHNPVSFSVSDAALATVAPGSSFTPPISAPFVVVLTPGLPATGDATVKVSMSDSLGNKGELDITFSAPATPFVPDVIVATVGTPVVS
jgi:hypothetical protein